MIQSKFREDFLLNFLKNYDFVEENFCIHLIF